MMSGLSWERRWAVPVKKHKPPEAFFLNSSQMRYHKRRSCFDDRLERNRIAYHEAWKNNARIANFF